MRSVFKLRSLAGAIVLVMLKSAPALGQAGTFGIDLTQVLSAGDGIDRRCVGPRHSTGVGPVLAFPVVSRVVSVALSARVYPVSRGPSCAIEVLPLPPDGTFTVEDRHELMAGRFATTDVRLRLHPVPALMFGAGTGVAWHRGTDLPYAVTAAGYRLPTGGRLKLWLAVEAYAVRVVIDRTMLTFANGVLVNAGPTIRHRQWSRMINATVSGVIPVF